MGTATLFLALTLAPGADPVVTFDPGDFVRPADASTPTKRKEWVDQVKDKYEGKTVELSGKVLVHNGSVLVVVPAAGGDTRAVPVQFQRRLAPAVLQQLQNGRDVTIHGKGSVKAREVVIEGRLPRLTSRERTAPAWLWITDGHIGKAKRSEGDLSKP